MDQKIDAITKAFQSDLLSDRFDYIKLYYETYLPQETARQFTILGEEYLELDIKVSEYKHQYMQQQQMGGSMKTVSDTDDSGGDTSTNTD